MSDTLRMVVVTRSRQPAALRMREQDVAAALAGRPSLSARLDVVFDHDLRVFPDCLKGGDALVLPATIEPGWRDRLARLAEISAPPAFVFVTGAGIDQLLPLDWLPDGVPLLTNRGVHGDAVTHYVTMALLLLNHSIPAQFTAWSRGEWLRRFPTGPAGKRLLVVGAGGLGAAAARAGRALGLTVAGVRSRAGAHPDFDEMAGPEGLDDGLALADFVVLTPPLNRQTHRMIDRRRLSLLKPQAGLVNISRGEVLDSDALVDALRSGAISGAVIDVLESEPPAPDSPIWTAPHLIVTPHIAGVYADQYVPKTLDLLLRAAEDHLDGREIANSVDRSQVEG